MASSVTDLIRARINGDDALEMIDQPERSLSVTRSTIERETMLRRQFGQAREQRRGIKRAKGGVERRAIGEVILEFQSRLRWKRAGGSTPGSGSG